MTGRPRTPLDRLRLRAERAARSRARMAARGIPSIKAVANEQQRRAYNQAPPEKGLS